MINIYINQLKRSFCVSGKSSVNEYWTFSVVNTIILFILKILDIYLNLGISILSILFGIFIIFPQISILIRRLHDVDKSGWFSLYCLIPFVGWFYILLLTLRPSNKNN
jgi:uncharacterized membrane protein YhaH (DUF805 family)